MRTRRRHLRRPRPFRAFLIKKLAEYRHYRLDYTVGVLIKLIFFVAMLLSLGAEDTLGLVVRVTAFALWYFAAHILGKLGNIMIEEASLGTLAQILVTRTSLTAFAIVSGLTEAVVSTIWVVPFLVLVAAARLIPIGPVIAALSGLTVAGIALTAVLALGGIIGIGLTLFGVSLAWKQVGSFTEVVIFYMLLFSGFFLPLERVPALIMLLGYASPLYWAVQALTDVVHGVSPMAGWGAMVLLAAGWNGLGLVTTQLLLQKVKGQGTLTHY